VLLQLVFLPLVRSYLLRSRETLRRPAEYGLERAANFYISGPTGAVLGAWYLWPEGGAPSPRHIPANSTLVLYFHGNSMDRGFGHRVQLYRRLTGLGCHLLAFDYRSYGDSSRTVLSEQSVVEDGAAALVWIEHQVPAGTRLVLWGHSLGTAVATRVLATAGTAAVSGLVLESPFNTMEDEVKTFRLARLAAWLGGLDIGQELRQAGLGFRTEDWLPQVRDTSDLQRPAVDRCTWCQPLIRTTYHWSLCKYLPLATQ
jgi:pimeloyl-ACP methyl ester carboxylesterase